MNDKAYVNSYQSFATLDGRGIRFAVFFQGCNLRCNFCHNPETWKIKSGEEVACDELIKKVLNYEPYFKGGGGVTLSGGEPLMQADFLLSFCKKLKDNKINIALDTSGSIFNEKIKQIIDLTDHVILDLKFNSREDYNKYCGGSFETIINFLNYLQSKNKYVWVRTVIIPDINDSESEIKKYVNIIKQYPCIAKYELLAFSTLGFSKYEQLSLNNPLLNTPPLGEKIKNKLQHYADSLLK